MGPIILLDKSIFNSLNYNEMSMLNRYYFLNIPPILIVEVLGDLTKTFKSGGSSEERVKHFANKLYQADSGININCYLLIHGSLAGNQPPMMGSIVVDGGKDVTDKDGKNGVYLDMPAEEMALDRWRSGKILEAEKLLSEQWRNLTQNIDISKLQRIKWPLPDKIINSRDINDIMRTLNEMMAVPEYQTDLLKLMLEEFQISQRYASAVFLRWERENIKQLNTFAPYAFYCLKVFMLFCIALSKNMIGEKPTNRIDLEYLYYLPFCMVFSSGDKVHNLLAPPLLRENQTFVDGALLKSDLNSIFQQWNILTEPQNEEWNRKHRHRPPVNSYTFSLWKKHMRMDDNPTPESVIDSSKQDNIDDNQVDFIIRKKLLAFTDPCHCHSGKMYRDCHLGKEAESMIKAGTISSSWPCYCNSGKSLLDCHMKHMK